MFKDYDNQDTAKDFIYAYSWILETKEFASFMEAVTSQLASCMKDASIFVIPSIYGTDFLNCVIHCNQSVVEKVRSQVDSLVW